MTDQRSPRGQEILNVATEVFLELGYGATTVDEIVRRAGGSKATIYKHFGNKEQLFVAVVDGIVGEIETPIPEDATDRLGIEGTLRQAAEDHLTVVLSERHAQLMRMVAAEAGRFPELGASYYAHGPELGHAKVAELLRREAAAGTIDCPDPVLAADDFWGMVLHHGTLRRLYGVIDPPSPSEVEKLGAAAVERFLRLYRLTEV